MLCKLWGCCSPRIITERSINCGKRFQGVPNGGSRFAFRNWSGFNFGLHWHLPASNMTDTGRLSQETLSKWFSHWMLTNFPEQFARMFAWFHSGVNVEWFSFHIYGWHVRRLALMRSEQNRIINSWVGLAAIEIGRAAWKALRKINYRWVWVESSITLSGFFIAFSCAVSSSECGYRVWVGKQFVLVIGRYYCGWVNVDHFV